ncbi:hypothetical protein ACFWXK_30855 [Streptomyces sp. NPDC059070]|uniref:hypothetical protein n=1 Tax=unclassified Streptomyces TaxID=2593676 RepID=UPI0034E1977A
MSQQKQRNWFARHKVLTGVGAIVAVIAVGGAVGAGGGSDDTSPSASATRETGTAGQGGQQKKEEPKKKEKEEAKGLDGSGSYQVGADIEPGTYVSSGNKDGCYWERAKDASGSTDAILANDNVTGASYVTVSASDKVFKSSDCQDWHRVGPKAAGAPRTTLKGGGGMFKVGTDIAPGTYKSTGNKDDACYWERAKDASHSTDAILANDNVSGTAVVRIGAGDAYFKSTGCQDWVKTG